MNDNQPPDLTPYYDQDGIRIYCGDCREILPLLAPVDTIITDPVWPNAAPHFIGSDRPAELLRETLSAVDGCQRVAIQLGCDSDPRFLSSVPARWPFFRVCWLEYACPTRKGRILYTGDVAYVFGQPPRSVPGRRVISGRCINGNVRDHIPHSFIAGKQWSGVPVNGEHPAPRRLGHVQWLVSRLADGIVLDPFCGSGTTLVAAQNGGYPAIGIEIEERYCEIAVKRLGQGVLQFGSRP